MRYFKYDGEMADLDALKKKHQALTNESKKAARRKKLLHRLGTAVFWVVFLAALSGLLFLIVRFVPESDHIVVSILDGLFTVVLGLFAVILSIILGSLAAMPFWSRYQKSEKELTQKLLHDASEYLRRYYGFREPYLVTKCYQCSDARFNRHDVCLYMVGEELYITANLHYGFFDSKRDLGCYAFTREEISLTDTQYKDRPAVELSVGAFTFLLGHRAKSFIYQDNGGKP